MNGCVRSDLDDDEELGCGLAGVADALAPAVDVQLELLRNRRRERALLGLGVVAVQEVQVTHPLTDDVVRRLAAQRRREHIEQRACTRHARSATMALAVSERTFETTKQSRVVYRGVGDSIHKDQKEPSRGRVRREPAGRRPVVGTIQGVTAVHCERGASGAP